MVRQKEEAMKKKSILLVAFLLVFTLSTCTVFAGEYTVKEGDRLWKIAKDLNVSMDSLIQWNQLSNANLIYAGQVLKTTGDAAVNDSNLPAATSTTSSEKAKPEVIDPKSDIDEYGGADYYDNAGDHSDSKYYMNPDFYNMKSDDELTIISNFKTFQQTSEWSCGSATLLMVLENFGVTDYSEWDIATISGADVDLDTADSEPGSADNYPEYGTSVDDIIRFFDTIDSFKVVETSYTTDYQDSDLIQEGDTNSPENDWGNLPGTFNSVALYASDNDPNTENWVDDAKDSYFVNWVLTNLNANRPIMVEWSDWDGHWQAIIGYDTNGTAGIGDDVIIFADPYDTSDSWQDGYYYYPAERWFYMWHDRAVAPKPYQLQPYVIVEPIK